jgi:tetratricopeptide (TPR) repeat protein
MTAISHLSATYSEIKRLRSCGRCDEALALLTTHAPRSDADAFEGVVCLLITGNVADALNASRTRKWTTQWAADMARALTEATADGEGSRALEAARRAASSSAAPDGVRALYLLLLQRSGRSDEAYRYMSTSLNAAAPDDVFLRTLMAEVAASAQSWGEGYRHACAVLANDPDDYRALVVLSLVSYELGNVHESLGHALRASTLRPGAAPAILQVMRCRNELGDQYGALAAADSLPETDRIPPDFHVELGRAYSALGNADRAIAEYRAALDFDASSAVALRALAATYSRFDRRAELDALVSTRRESLYRDFESLYALGVDALARGDIDAAAECFRVSSCVAERNGDIREALEWPLHETRVRHDVEQLDLLERRGKLDAGGRGAMDVLKRFRGAQSAQKTTSRALAVGRDELATALCTSHYVPEVPVTAPVLGENDYATIEARYLESGSVVVDDFLTAPALAAMRQFCEEATVWKFSYERGYVGARLAQGFSPRVLLCVADELKRRMPHVIGERPLTQAWGFKYDQRKQGINLHADFADVNVNFWITADEACEDPTSGGLVVYDLPVPRSWTFAEYNNNSPKLAAYLRERKAVPLRIGYRANRCVIFDSSLIHTTDEMRFRPGYENRRVNVTLLYGHGRNAE